MVDQRLLGHFFKIGHFNLIFLLQGHSHSNRPLIPVLVLQLHVKSEKLLLVVPKRVLLVVVPQVTLEAWP